MSSFGRQHFNPRANVFLLVNLGCEMLYVIDQRLKAQQIAEDKSIQVIHDVTAVLLEPKFIDSLILGSTHNNSQLLTADHCKFMLKDIATCSLMRLDEASMDKLWNLMTMIYKWQLYVSKAEHHLLDITFRHLDAVAKIYPDEKRIMLIDFTKNTLLDFWNATTDAEQQSIYYTNKSWLQCFNTKISLLIRLEFQALDGSFLANVEQSYYHEFADTIGENIYTKSMDIAAKRRQELNIANKVSNPATRRVDQLAELLNLPSRADSNADDLQPIDVGNFQKQFEQNLQQCNILFEDLDNPAAIQKKITPATTSASGYNIANLFPDSSTHSIDSNVSGTATATTLGGGEEFITLRPIYNRNIESASNAMGTMAAASGNRNESSGSGVGSSGGSAAYLNKDLLELYSRM